MAVIIKHDSMRQADTGISYDGDQSVMLPKTPIDKALEIVETKYGSITKAPKVAVEFVQSVAKKEGLFSTQHSGPRKAHHYKTIHASKSKRKATPVPSYFKLWKSGDRYCTNYKNLVHVIKYINECNYSPRSACQWGNFPYYKFRNLSKYLYHYGYVWHRGKVTQRVGQMRKLFKYCKALNWSFGPMSYEDLYHHNYEGTIKRFAYYSPVYYRKEQ